MCPGLRASTIVVKFHSEGTISSKHTDGTSALSRLHSLLYIQLDMLEKLLKIRVHCIICNITTFVNYIYFVDVNIGIVLIMFVSCSFASYYMICKWSKAFVPFSKKHFSTGKMDRLSKQSRLLTHSPSLYLY